MEISNTLNLKTIGMTVDQSERNWYCETMLGPISSRSQARALQREKYENEIADRTFFHAAPLSKKVRSAWHAYLSFEDTNRDPTRLKVLFGRCLVACAHYPELKKNLEQNFRVLSEMRILGKNRVAILDFGRVSTFFSEIWREIRF